MDQRKELERKRWQERLVELHDFKVRYGTWPRFRNAVSEAERILGVWLHGQRQKASRDGLSARELQALDAAATGWNTWRPQKSHRIIASGGGVKRLPFLSPSAGQDISTKARTPTSPCSASLSRVNNYDIVSSPASPDTGSNSSVG